MQEEHDDNGSAPGLHDRDETERTTHTAAIEGLAATTIAGETGEGAKRPVPKGRAGKRTVMWRARMMERRLERLHGGKVQRG